MESARARRHTIYREAIPGWNRLSFAAAELQHGRWFLHCPTEAIPRHRQRDRRSRGDATPARDDLVVLDADPRFRAWIRHPKGRLRRRGVARQGQVPVLPARSVRHAEEQLLRSWTGRGHRPVLLHAHPSRHVLRRTLAGARTSRAIRRHHKAIQRHWPSCQPYGSVYDSVIPRAWVSPPSVETSS